MGGHESIFDSIKQDDVIMAFFPCTRFSCQSQLNMTTNGYQFKNYTDEKRVEYSMKHGTEQARNYNLLCKLFLICYKKGLRMIVENPHNQPHYLTMYFPIKPSMVDKDRTERGDKFEKPTQFWFVNCHPQNNVIVEYVERVERVEHVEHVISRENRKRQEIRSEITPVYANRFIREFIMDAV